jgi:hypothetical protein
MDRINQPHDVVHRGVGKDPVAKIEDVAGPAFSTFQNSLDLFLDPFNGTEQNHRVEVSLDGHIVPNAAPGLP